MAGRFLLASACLVLLLATGASAGGKQYAPTFWAALGKNPATGMSITRKVVEASGMKPYFSKPRIATFFPPDDEAWRQLLSGDMKISVEELLLPTNRGLLRELVKSLIVPGKRIFTPNWPKWPKKDWYQTAQPGNKIGLEMDDGGARPGDIFDVDGTDDDAELVPKSWVINLICGPGVMQTVDDVPTWKGWKGKVLKNVAKARRAGHTRPPHTTTPGGRCRDAPKGCKPFAVIGRSG
ncbi:hypothetical protein ABPG75_005421 [Micractinium tetrahymenae]